MNQIEAKTARAWEEYVEREEREGHMMESIHVGLQFTHFVKMAGQTDRALNRDRRELRARLKKSVQPLEKFWRRRPRGISKFIIV